MASTPLLPFLRPLPLPRIQSVRTYFRRTITTTTSITPSQSEAPPTLTPTASTPAATPPAPAPQTILKPLSYHVHRTPSQQLPVYLTAKRGGNLHQTRLKKIEGNISELRNDLQAAMGLEEEHIGINHLTRHIIIKGWRRTEVMKFLEGQHF